MPTSLTPALFLSEDVVPMETLVFFRHHIQNVVHDVIAREFHKLAAAGEMNNGRLAHRIRRDAGRVSKWLSWPSNMTLNSISDLMVGLAIDPSKLLADEMAVVDSQDSETSPADDMVLAMSGKPSEQAPPEPEPDASLVGLSPIRKDEQAMLLLQRRAA